jgi:hypothetical protein
MNPDETRTAAAAAFFGSLTADKASICYTAGDAMLAAPYRPEFFAKLRTGQCTFDDDTRQSGFVEVANRKVYFTANAGMVSIRATNELELSRATSTLAAHAARTEVARQAEIAAATQAHKRWEPK